MIVTFLFGYMNVNAEEENINITNEEITEESKIENNEISNETIDVNREELPLTSDDREDNNPIITPNPTVPETEENTVEVHKVAVITTKVDEEGNPLAGALLQIIDKDGNVVDEWISDGTAHESLLPEGNYILHEVKAPEGYVKADDKSFTVKVEINDITAGVDYTGIPCEHYGSPFYYVESNGVKEEVYCINQDWETPDDNPSYDGSVITPDNIRDYTTQTVYVDAHQNKEKKDISDQTLSDKELYNKILDIIYHRQKASEIFSDLSEDEIRFITESALKNYTNAGLTRVQRVAVSKVPENYDAFDSYTTTDGKYVWYLYPHFRTFVYDPSQPLGTDVCRTVVGEGDAFGVLAGHWSAVHGARDNEEARQQLARYYELYQYLISDSDHHPADMHLYVYSALSQASGSSKFNFDDGAYQNLLGITWFNPYDENYKVELKCVNTEKEKPSKKDEIVPPITGINSTNNSNYLYVIALLLGGLGLSIKKRFN